VADRPDVDRLAPGSAVVLVIADWYKPYIQAELEEGSETAHTIQLRPFDDRENVCRVPAGTRALVTADDGGADDPLRPVQLRILEGDRRDQLWYACRHELRLMPGRSEAAP
jgi:hypothetical protein